MNIINGLNKGTVLYWLERFIGRKPNKLKSCAIPDIVERVVVRQIPGETDESIFLELEEFHRGKWCTIPGSRLRAYILVRDKNKAFPSGTHLLPKILPPNKKGYIWRKVEFHDYPASRLLALHVPVEWDARKWFKRYNLTYPKDLLGISHIPRG